MQWNVQFPSGIQVIQYDIKYHQCVGWKHVQHGVQEYHRCCWVEACPAIPPVRWMEACPAWCTRIPPVLLDGSMSSMVHRNTTSAVGWKHVQHGVQEYHLCCWVEACPAWCTGIPPVLLGGSMSSMVHRNTTCAVRWKHVQHGVQEYHLCC